MEEGVPYTQSKLYGRASPMKISMSATYVCSTWHCLHADVGPCNVNTCQNGGRCTDTQSVTVGRGTSGIGVKQVKTNCLHAVIIDVHH